MPTPLEAPITIDDREELVFLLCEAAELEHSLACAYLFAAWSLRTGEDDGLNPHQLTAVRDWERTVTAIAVQEMTHLTLASNLLTSLGAAPHFARPNLPQRTRYYPDNVQLSLEPFNEATLRHFIYLERPEGMSIEDADEFAPPGRAEVPWQAPGRVVPGGQEFATVGHLYRGVADGFRTLVERLGAERVFLGTTREQARREDFGWDELVPVVDLASALETIETIVEEGEGARGDWEDAHYGRYLAIQAEYDELLGEDPDFVPARPVLSNPFARQPVDADRVNLLSDPFTIEVAVLANAAYAAMLQVLTRCFAHGSETDEELRALAGIGVRQMFTVVRPLGQLLTRLPAGPNHPGMTAGMSFELYRSLHLLPHRHAAWALVHERFHELGARADELSHRATGEVVAKALGDVAAAFADLSQTLAAHVREHDLDTPDVPGGVR